MSENEPRPAGQDPVDQTVEQPTLPPPGLPPAPEQGQSPRRPWRERSWSLPVVVAVALVAVLLGGLGGAALASVGGHQDGGRGPGFGGFRHGPGGFGQGPGRGFGQGPGQQLGPRQRQGQQGQQPRPFGNGASPSPAPASPSPTT